MPGSPPHGRFGSTFAWNTLIAYTVAVPSVSHRAEKLVWRCFGWLLKLVRREKGHRGFKVQEKRWIVERTFSWMGGWRRLSKDYEHLPKVSEAMVRISAMRLMIRRLA